MAQCNDDDVPQVQYSFVTIEGLGAVEKDKIVGSSCASCEDGRTLMEPCR